ncbi:MAG TPA: HU family DNA-binding protein [Anaerolineales bacterium]|nr:HU family DNA-binding protein [Anaerolineales bacterium]
MPGTRLSKSQFVEMLAKHSGLTKKQVVAVLDALNATITHQLSKRGPGEVILPGLLRLAVAEKPATAAHEGINPFTKEPMTYKAKPARRVIKVRPLKGLKDAI